MKRIIILIVFMLLAGCSDDFEKYKEHERKVELKIKANLERALSFSNHAPGYVDLRRTLPRDHYIMWVEMWDLTQANFLNVKYLYDFRSDKVKKFIVCW